MSPYCNYFLSFFTIGKDPSFPKSQFYKGWKVRWLLPTHLLKTGPGS